MQPAQHAAKHFNFLSCELNKIKAFSIKNATQLHLFGNFWSISWQNIEFFINFLQNMLKTAVLGFFHEQAFLDSGFLT